MKIVFLDAKTIGEDIDLTGFDRFGEVVKYGFSSLALITEILCFLHNSTMVSILLACPYK